jgi:hypothetical protein
VIKKSRRTTKPHEDVALSAYDSKESEKAALPEWLSEFDPEFYEEFKDVVEFV